MELPTFSTYRPTAPLLIWDGQCGFCKYWVTRLKHLTGSSVLYAPYQEIHQGIKEISEKKFQKAIRLIDTNGKIYSGAGAAYKTLEKKPTWAFLISWYTTYPFFRAISDIVYRFVSNHRSSLFKVSKFLFGENPIKLHHYWICYLGILLLVVILLLNSILT
ncbi:DCC1-like thiol-disulfide oxidoreductase family protein [Muricauda oceani]|uniref:DUF393 domain-containing protein n=1 Tax=Flagellimonas oceani TaxID=2698672 RepID=A0A6G7J287_9FLAO|nr:DCC1-like thiol-disulfide oxidoreductase family protein [Allomuricauda oceani]MBW8244006.1 DCC1-like thiol-disulfide oxidoreductase family protein [Allomuricauda oceani]QII44983.1 DUF393 domain-containing protein [Allomuricauda oceani]